MPADGFYEWQGAGRKRRPHHLTLPGGALFALAGVFERWRGEEGAALDSFALLTCEARGAARDVHPRMPVIVAPPGYAAWLDPALEDGATALDALRGGLADALVARAVDRRVNDPRHDDPACLAAEPELPLFDDAPR